MHFKLQKTLFLFLPFSFLLILLAKGSTRLTETLFSNGIYKLLSQAGNTITGLLPFSLMEIMLLLVPIFLILGVIRIISRLRQKKAFKKILASVFWNGMAIISVLFFIYTMNCGLNYYRYPFTEYSGLTIEDSTLEQLKALCFSLSKEANTLRDQLKEDENGVVDYGFSIKEMAEEARLAMEQLSQDYPVMAGYYSAPKPVLFSEFMSRMEITGIFWPFTLEANVNVHTNDLSIPATMGHELSHLRGFMREDEANYIGYLACRYSKCPEFQYSGVTTALVYAGNQLYREDPYSYWEVTDTWSDGLKRDLDADSRYWAAYEDTVISQVSGKMNDTYLKANSQSDGTKSYGRMVDLLLAEFKSRN